ncbi:acetate--CoA ligase family protein [Actinophytocola sediminis]
MTESLLAGERAAARARLAALFEPPAVTLVGASPNSHATTALYRNLTREDRRFPRPVHLVNPNRPDVLGHPTVPSLDAIDGDLGLVYLLVGADRSMAVLAEIADKGLADRISGIVAYAAGFAEAGDPERQDRLAAAANALGLPLLGPQSTGIISAAARLVAVTDPVPEEYVPGRVGFVAQSTGLLGGAVGWLMRRGIGIGVAVGFGNAAAISYPELASVLLERDDLDVVCVYADALADVSALAGLGDLARRVGKPVIVYRGAQTPSARRLAMSHTGMLATSERVVRGVAEQHGILVADSFEELLWAAELFVRADVRALTNPGVGVITGSGGGGLIAAESIERAGMVLAAPTEQTRGALALAESQQANPLDVGAISLDRTERYQELVTAFAADPNFGIVVKVGSLGAPSEAMPTHHRMTGMFASAAVAAGKLPVVAFSFPEDPRDFRETVPWDGVLVVGGEAELVGKLRLLNGWAGGGPTAPPESPAASPAADLALAVAGDEVGLDLARSLGLGIPRSVTVHGAVSGVDWEPVVAKTAKALPHRAKVGGVILGLRGADQVQAATTLLAARFDAPVTLAEQVDHDEAYFLGLQRDAAGHPLIAFGGGVATDDSEVAIRLCPIDAAEAARLVARAGGPAELGAVLVLASELIASRPDLAVVDMNPIVRARDGSLVAIDVKVYPSTLD